MIDENVLVFVGQKNQNETSKCFLLIAEGDKKSDKKNIGQEGRNSDTKGCYNLAKRLNS